MLAIIEQGLILSLLSIGVFLAFRVVNLPDLTVDGSFALGAAIAVKALFEGISPIMAITMAAVGGALAGFITALIHRRFKVNVLLAGILVMTMLYSVNLRIMGGPNLPVPRVSGQQQAPSYESMSGGTLLDDLFADSKAADGPSAAAQKKTVANLFTGRLDGQDLSKISIVIIGALLLLSLFLRTDLGTSLRAFGCNPAGVTAFCISQIFLAITGLVIGNLMVGLSGGLFALYSGFSDVTLGQGMVVTGLASVILGEIIFGRVKVFYGLLAPISGAVIYQGLLSTAMRYGYRIGFLASDMKLLTALFVISVIGIRQFASKPKKQRLRAEVKRLWLNSRGSR